MLAFAATGFLTGATAEQEGTESEEDQENGRFFHRVLFKGTLRDPFCVQFSRDSSKFLQGLPEAVGHVSAGRRLIVRVGAGN